MIKTTTREIASSSDVNAPVFRFRKFVRSPQEPYHNNGQFIDFVTDGDSLYVPSTDNVMPCKDSIEEDGGFMRLVSKGKPGIQGLKGDPGRDGRTPSVFARFDGRQMIFYTNEINEDGTPKIDDKGNPVTRRIAATNDLTGPSWRPKKVDDTIIWEKTRDDSQPESINLSDLVKETAPVIFRVDSDNTKRSDETSGPANYIQWKYEGDEYWNNLISISELMNLALAGVCIWFDEDDQEYHLGHRQVLHATYDSSKTGKRIISDVEHGDVLYDAGPIHLPDFEADIAALWEEVCALKDRVEAIEEELPQFIKKSDIAFEVREEQDGRFLYMSLDGRSTWTKIIEATCVCKKEVDPTIYYTIFFETPTPSTAIMTYSGVVKYPGSQVRVPSGTTVVLEADAEGYKHYKETQLINADYHFKPVLTKESAPEVKYSACVIDETGSADRIYIGTISANKQQACLENLSNGTTVYGKATRSGYKDKTVSGVINNDNLELPITGEWESSTVPVDYVRIGEGDTYTMYVGDTHCFTANVRPDNATNKNVTWSVSNRHAEVDSNGCVVALSATEPTVTLTVRTIDGGKEYDCVITILERETPPETTLSVNPSTLNFGAADGNKDFTVTTNADDYIVSEACDWVTTSKSGNTVTVTVTANTGTERYCDISVSAGDQEKTLRVTQEAGEVAPTTKYEVSIGDTCNADTAYLTKTEGGSSIGQTYQADKNEIIWLHAEKSGKKAINKPSDMIKDNYSFVINCDEWKDETEPEIEVAGISLNESTMSLTYASCDGHIYGTTSDTLIATITPSDATNKNVNWTTSEPSVVTVSRGVVTANGVGTATITATAAGDNSKTATCTVTVTDARVPATEISLNKQATTLTVGSTETLKATLTPSCSTSTVIWSSNNTSVATVDNNGEVTAMATGTTTITAKAGSKTAACTVTVSNEVISVTGVSLDKTNLTLNLSCDEEQLRTDTLVATVYPNAATNKSVTWSCSDENIVIAREGSSNNICDLIPVTEGTAVVTVTTVDGNKTVQCNVTVTNNTEITLSPSEKTMYIGQKYILDITPRCIPDNEITWATSDGSIATVDAGIVDAKGIGSARISATVGTETVYCDVTVKDVEIQRIELNKDSIALTYASCIDNDKAEIRGDVITEPVTTIAKYIVWGITGDSIRFNQNQELVTTARTQSTSSLQIVPVGVGSATIVAKPEGQETNEFSDKWAYCTVTVTAADVPATDITFEDKSEMQVYPGGTNKRIPLITPTCHNTSDSITWTVEPINNSVITIDSDGLVTGVNTGIATVTATLENGESDSYPVKVVSNPDCNANVSPNSITIDPRGETDAIHDLIIENAFINSVNIESNPYNIIKNAEIVNGTQLKLTVGTKTKVSTPAIIKINWTNTCNGSQSNTFITINQEIYELTLDNLSSKSINYKIDSGSELILDASNQTKVSPGSKLEIQYQLSEGVWTKLTAGSIIYAGTMYGGTPGYTPDDKVSNNYWNVDIDKLSGNDVIHIETVSNI